jgi:energy-coupling factor transporter ATP-binding protein EcfA2
MRRLERPNPPNSFLAIINRGRAELRNGVEAWTTWGPGSLREHNLLFRQRSTIGEIRAIMSVASHGTCHACEQSVEANVGELEFYRPLKMAGNFRKDRNSPTHYGWLSYDWNNLQLLCPMCNRCKASLFPIAGERAPIGARGEQLLGERPLLLNPFDDDPAEHIATCEDGFLIALTERGQTTIEVYQLNRADLLNQRKSFFKRLRALVTQLGVSRVSSAVDKKAAIASVLDLVGMEFRGSAIELLEKVIRAPGAITQVAASKAISATPPTSIPKKFETRWIKCIHLVDCGPLRDIRLAFPDPQEGLEPWLGIVGENGVGKSTFLKAIAVALSSEEDARAICPDARLLHNRSSHRRTGLIEIECSDGSTRRVTFGRHSTSFQFSGPRIDIPVIAFGANRITSRKGAARDLPTATTVNNLFDPILPLTDTEEWLANTRRVSAEDFAGFAQDLKFLLDLPDETHVDRRNGLIHFSRGTERHGLSELSDGFRSVIGLVGHIMRYLSTDTPVMSEAEGTVLLDEIELHLHPQWKIKIVDKLRRLFPRVRFVITTHDPLCLRGLKENESFALRKHPARNRVEALALRLRPGISLEELLTGGWFELGTTLDSETADMIFELSALSLKADALSVRGQESLPEQDRLDMETLHQELQRRLTSWGGAVGERRALAAAASLRVAPDEARELDRQALKARLKAAFSTGGEPL